jgi:hypothetical protein
MPPTQLSLSVAAVLLSPASLPGALYHHFEAILDTGRALPVWLEPEARAPSAWALIAFQHGAPDCVAGQGFLILRMSAGCGTAPHFGICIDATLTMMAEALRVPELASVAWSASFAARIDQTDRRLAA